ncbi:MAG: outer membrane beta-barrel protein [Marinilabiliaceae bacterium]
MPVRSCLTALSFASARLWRLGALVVAMCVVCEVASAQCSVRGVVTDDADGSVLPSASVVAFVSDEARGGASSDSDGRFVVDSLAVGDYSLRVSFVGYEPMSVDVKFSAARRNVDVGRLRLTPSGRMIDEVSVVGQVARQEQRGDTTVLNAAAFKVNPDATTEDLLRKMPGMQVRDGQVTHGGESVKKVLVDGKEFFGSDPSAALKNIDATMVDKIEVFDKQSEQAEFTGFSDGKEERTINILTKAGLTHGVFGRAAAGLGTSGHFEVDGVANVFSADTRVSVVGSFNDVDRQGFSSPDAGGGSAGVNKNGSFGINHNFERAKKLRIESSYVFAYRDNSVTSSRLQEYFQDFESDSVHSYASNSVSSSLGRAHRLSLRLRWQPDESNVIVLTPSYNWQGNSSGRSSDGVDSRGSVAYSSTTQSSESDGSSWSLGGGVTWRRKMSVARRTFSVSVRTSLQRSSSDALSRGAQANGSDFQSGLSAPPAAPDSLSAPPDKPSDDSSDVPPDAAPGGVTVTGQQSSSSGRSLSLSARVIYTEPLAEHWMASVNYAPSLSLNSNNKAVLADTVIAAGAAADASFSSFSFSPALSNDKDSRYLVHRAGVAVNANRGKALRASVGLDAQHSILSGDQTYPVEFSTRRSFFSLMPSVEMSATSANGANLKFKYRTSSSAPSITQLQDVVDVSDVRRYSAGNPSLRQSVTHRLDFVAAHTDKSSARSLFFLSNVHVTRGFVASASVMATADSALASGVTLPAGVQLTVPVNLDGQVSASVSLTLSSPLGRTGCNASLSLIGSLQRTPGLFNGVRINSSSSSVTLGMSLGSAFSETFDFNVAYNPSYNAVRSTRAAESDYDYYSHALRADVNALFFSRHFAASSSVVHNFTSGMGGGFDNNYVLWNASVAFKFLPRRQAEFRLRVNDILDSNKSSSRSVSDAYVQTSSSNVLHRYAMLTFSYKFNEAASQAQSKDDRGRRLPKHPMGGPGGDAPGGRPM